MSSYACPRCKYLMSVFDAVCPRCHNQRAPLPQLNHSETPAEKNLREINERQAEQAQAELDSQRAFRWLFFGILPGCSGLFWAVVIFLGWLVSLGK